MERGPGMTRRSRRGWADAEAARVLDEVLASVGGRAALRGRGRLRRVGRGLTYEVFGTDCSLPGEGGTEGRWVVVRVPHHDAGPDQPELARREAALLARLATSSFPLRLPRVLGTATSCHGVAMVQEHVDGVPVEFRARRALVPPWDVAAEAAAHCHAVPPGLVADLLPSHGTRRGHVEARLAELTEDLPEGLPEVAEAAAWVRAHLPPAEPARLLHGDLLGQNLLLSLEGEPLGVVDWAFAELGDPANDLAVMTRGAARPFQDAGGREKLLAAYNARAEDPLTPRDLALQDLLFAAGSYVCEAEEHGADSVSVVNVRNQLAAALRRAECAGGG